MGIWDTVSNAGSSIVGGAGDIIKDPMGNIPFNPLDPGSYNPGGFNPYNLSAASLLYGAGEELGLPVRQVATAIGAGPTQRTAPATGQVAYRDSSNRAAPAPEPEQYIPQPAPAEDDTTMILVVGGVVAFGALGFLAYQLSK